MKIKLHQLKWIYVIGGLILLFQTVFIDAPFSGGNLAVGALFMFLGGAMFERYPRTPKEFTGFTTETDVPVGDLRNIPPVALDGKGTRRFELHYNDMHTMQHPIREITELLIEEGFDMSGEIVWWDDFPNNKRIFTQEV